MRYGNTHTIFGVNTGMIMKQGICLNVLTYSWWEKKENLIDLFKFVEIAIADGVFNNEWIWQFSYPVTRIPEYLHVCNHFRVEVNVAIADTIEQAYDANNSRS